MSLAHDLHLRLKEMYAFYADDIDDEAAQRAYGYCEGLAYAISLIEGDTPLNIIENKRIGYKLDKPHPQFQTCNDPRCCCLGGDCEVTGICANDH